MLYLPQCVTLTNLTRQQAATSFKLADKHSYLIRDPILISPRRRCRQWITVRRRVRPEVLFQMLTCHTEHNAMV